MTTKYTIETKEVGTSFGVEGIILKNDSEIVYRGPIRPFGFDSMAHQDAVDEARNRGLTISDYGEDA